MIKLLLIVLLIFVICYAVYFGFGGLSFIINKKRYKLKFNKKNDIIYSFAASIVAFVFLASLGTESNPNKMIIIDIINSIFCILLIIFLFIFIWKKLSSSIHINLKIIKTTITLLISIISTLFLSFLIFLPIIATLALQEFISDILLLLYKKIFNRTEINDKVIYIVTTIVYVYTLIFNYHFLKQQI